MARENLRVEDIIKEGEKIKKKIETSIEKQIENLNFELDLEGEEYITVHPALDFKGVAYLGVWLPTKKGKDVFCLLTSDRRLIVCKKENLNSQRIKLQYPSIKFKKRQPSLKIIRDFLQGNVSINPKKLYEEIKQTIDKYIDLANTDFITLWIMGTYLFPIFKAYPYVYVTGIKQSGKTKLLYVTSLLAFNSIFSVNASLSSIFRLIQNGRCSLFIDETEKLSNPERAMEFRAILLQGYKQGGDVQRVEKNTRDKYTVEFFDVYSPKMLANISGLEDVLEDRCIKIIMKRTTNKEIGDREIDETDRTWQELRDKLYIFALENWKKVEQIYKTLNNETNIKNREWELWHPILAIAKFLDENIYKEMINLAETKSKEKQIDNITETAEYLLVETLMELVRNHRFYKVKEIKEEMKRKIDDEPHWLSSKWVGNALKRLGITERRRVGSGVEFRISPLVVKELAERLGISSLIDSPNSSSSPNSQKTDEYSELSVCSEQAKNRENSYFFLRLPKSYFGVCSYCGEKTTVEWMDESGNHMCSRCRWESRKQKEGD
ncbi:MAG: hypothetical protein QXS37_05230 [Candidatus Aenigmatarchaeota archaeon]